MTKEAWKEIPGYEGMYEVSSAGRVRQLKYSYYKNGRRIVTKERIVKQKFSNGYLAVKLNFFGQRYDELVHRLVASAFIRNPLKNRIVHHKDFNRYNNSVCNLAWTTYSKNNSETKTSLLKFLNGETK